MPISETQCSKTERAKKISVLNHNLLSKRTYRSWNSEKVANHPNKLVPFWNLCVHPHKSRLPLLPRRNLIRKVFPEGVGKCMKFRSHTDEIWWFAKNWTWWCSVNSQRNDNFDAWWTLQQLREVFHCTSPDTPRRTWRRSGLTKDYWVPS